MSKPCLLIISHVMPYPGSSGQQRRVRYKLQAFREHFHVTFLTAVPRARLPETEAALTSYCDESLVLPAYQAQNVASKLWHAVVSRGYQAFTGLKRSNYIIGKVEFSPERLVRLPNLESFNAVVYEYWHAVDSVRVFERIGIPCILDMHDILWKSYERQLESTRVPTAYKKWALRRYREHEYAAWHHFDALIAINQGEYEFVRSLMPEKRLFYTPMGIDITRWEYSWQPSSPPRIAYYGGLGNPYNQREAMRCYHQIMPRIWEKSPQAEFWIIGSNPPDFIQALHKQNPQTHVSGFVEDVQSLLKTVTAILCPFEGQFGFRSRLIEAMALGVPVIATPDAVYGMNLETGLGLFLSENNNDLADYSLQLIEQTQWAYEQSRLARKQVEEKFSFDETYSRLAQELYEYVCQPGESV